METNSRRIAENPEFSSKRDYLEYMMTINKDAQEKTKNSAYLSQTGAFDKFRGTYHDQTGTTVSPKKHARDLRGSPMLIHQDEVQVKPKLLESGLAARVEFQTLSPAFKSILGSERHEEKMRIPIVGYCGHRKGEKAENMFAKSYRENTIQATRNLRKTLALPNASK